MYKYLILALLIASQAFCGEVDKTVPLRNKIVDLGDGTYTDCPVWTIFGDVSPINTEVNLAKTHIKIRSMVGKNTYDDGSGTVVKYNGKLMILTAWHVLTGVHGTEASDKVVVYGDGVAVWITKYKKLPGDAAIIYLNFSDDSKYETLLTRPVKVGETCMSIGYRAGESFTKAQGEVLEIAGLSATRGGKPVWNILSTAYLSSGMSGGALMIDGKLAGINSQTMHGFGGTQRCHVSIYHLLEKLK